MAGLPAVGGSYRPGFEGWKETTTLIDPAAGLTSRTPAASGGS